MFTIGRRISQLARPILNICRNFQVSVIGASQPLGQTVAILLKQHPLVHRLTMYGAPERFGVAMDVPKSQKALDEDSTKQMDLALKCSEMVVVACGQPKQAGQTEQDHFLQNADSVIKAMHVIANHCPSAFVVVATEPINQTVPLAAKVLESCDRFDKSRVFGVTGLDAMRAQMWVGGMYQTQPQSLNIPVVCGHSPKTLVPLFSYIQPRFMIDNYSARYLTECIRNGDNQVADLRDGDAYAMSSAFATYCTASAILNAMNGYAVEHVAFVANNAYGTKFFAAPVIVTQDGITATMQHKVVTALEADYINQSVEQLYNDVCEGESYFKAEKRHYEKAKANIRLKKCIKTL